MSIEQSGIKLGRSKKAAHQTWQGGWVGSVLNLRGGGVAVAKSDLLVMDTRT